MKALIIINTILLLYIIIPLKVIPYLGKFTIHIKRTTWENKSFGFYILKWYHKHGTSPNHGIPIFQFNWRNADNTKKIKKVIIHKTAQHIKK